MGVLFGTITSRVHGRVCEKDSFNMNVYARMLVYKFCI